MKLSIVTPCFNSEKTIERTIKSVVEQDLSCELEYIIVDGKSSDNTCSIIKKYAERYPFIKWVSESDKSMTEALNKGLRKASGDILASINADDMYLPGTLEKVHMFFETNQDRKVCLINNYFVEESTQRVLSKNMPRLFNELICGLIECPLPECGIFFARECIDNVGLFNEQIKYTQDMELYLRIYKAGYKFHYSNIDASVFFRSDENYSTTIGDKMDAEVCTYYKYPKLFKQFSNSIASKLIKITLGIRRYYLSDIRLEEIVNK